MGQSVGEIEDCSTGVIESAYAVRRVRSDDAGVKGDDGVVYADASSLPDREGARIWCVTNYGMYHGM